MIRKLRFLIAVALASASVFVGPIGTSACAPDMPEAEIFSTSHPDLPLKLFAAGKFGILPASYAKSYLCVLYRYLNGSPLDKNEQESIINLWHKRLERQNWYSENNEDPAEKYLKLRSRVRDASKNKFAELYSTVQHFSYENGITAESFRLAADTLKARIARFGTKSPEVREWLQGQDAVFGISPPDKGAVPGTVPSTSPLLIRQDRVYQQAAAMLYQKDFLQAAQLFAKIAKDPESPWHELAPYLVARSKCNAALNSDDEKLLQETIDFIKSALAAAKSAAQSQPLYDLLTPLLYKQLPPDQFTDHLIKGILGNHTDRFGGDVGDLTFIMDEASNGSETSGEGSSEKTAKEKSELTGFERHDLTEWLSTITQSGVVWAYDQEEKKQARARMAANGRKAIEIWRKKKTLPWLLCAITGNGLRNDPDLLSAAEQITKGSPAFLTARFYIIDALIARGKNAEARQELERLLARVDLPPTTYNLFSAQMLKVAGTIDQYLRSTMMKAPAFTSSYSILPDNWKQQEKRSSWSTRAVVFDKGVAENLNRNLPQSIWMKLSKDPAVDPSLRRRIIRSTFVRAILLNHAQEAAQLAEPLAKSYPELSKYISAWKNAGSEDARNFAAARLVLHNYGMTPYLDSGVERHGVAMGVFDEYNANFWVPLPVDESRKNKEDDFSWPSISQDEDNQLIGLAHSYYMPGVQSHLSKSEIARAQEERQIIWRQHPSRFFGETVFAHLKKQPADPDLPEMLYKIVRLPKWTEVTPAGSEFSHKAYVLLHERYPNSSWSRKATCWY